MSKVINFLKGYLVTRGIYQCNKGDKQNITGEEVCLAAPGEVINLSPLSSHKDSLDWSGLNSGGALSGQFQFKQISTKVDICNKADANCRLDLAILVSRDNS